MAIPFLRDFDYAYGRADRLSDLVTRVIAPNPGPFTFTGSGTYIVGDARGVAVIDPGPDIAGHILAVTAALPGPLQAILVTHTHRDHCGGARALKAAAGGTVFAYGPHPSSPEDAPPALDEGADHEFRPDRTMSDGDAIRLPFGSLRALHTPGHISNHLCFALDKESALFSGDHIMGWATTVVAPPDGNMGDYMRSLELLLSRDDRVYYPTHGAPIAHPQVFVGAVKEHRLARDAAILAALSDTPKAALDIVDAVYEGLDPGLRPAASLNVAAHLAEHVIAGTVRWSEGGFTLA